ncbi:hypothetical protein SCH01S_10_00030 [Sphingomonas changbaiensis NBRC 104936]|uniref:DUF3617 family protein n=1 Tax=Sphingomonas changbaiensis NBRC 104936 TaxID=1219043 RepID=A0A0E9ML06_9SPHN|nr:hypothetical protein [Sphingomonas changbaiensis]GAO38193.1 hypothetical protein SCH01S_10_00030 [Sphingomonas changbaiensis NBRC 104936]
MRLLLILVAGAAALLLEGAANAPILAFGRIEPGEWQLRALDNSMPMRKLCIDDAYDLVQLRHPGAACSRFVLANEPQTATVHYTCAGAGYGRTMIRVETGQLVRIESQGLANRSPFEIALEGRRVGKCIPERAAR